MERLDERGIRHSGVKDRGFINSIYFQDPLGLLLELAAYPGEIHLADAIERLTAKNRDSRTDDRSSQHTYRI